LRPKVSGAFRDLVPSDATGPRVAPMTSPRRHISRNDGRASHRFSKTVVGFWPSPYAWYNGGRFWDVRKRLVRRVGSGRTTEAFGSNGGSVHERMLGRPIVRLKRCSVRNDGRSYHRFSKTMVVSVAAHKQGKHVVTRDLLSPGVASGTMPIQIYSREGVGSLPTIWGGVCSSEFQKMRGQTCSNA